MKIGILTYHRSHNFGALFQAIATRELLSSLGHKVYYIDYWPDYHVAMYSLFSWKAFMRGGLRYKYGYVKVSMKNYKYKAPLHRAYKKFIQNYIEPYCIPEGNSFDLIIYGSDQIWRKQPWLDDYNPVYFGVHNNKTMVHASYAASMGILSDKKEDLEKLKKLLSHFDLLSVREQSLLDLVNSLGYSKSRITIDPALLLEAEQWDKVFPISVKKGTVPYILYINYIKGSFDEYEIRIFAKSRGLKLIKINGSVIGKDTPDALVSVSPLEMFEYIKNASFVFTSSFHALVFSILYKKEFFASFANNALRAKSLLGRLNIEARLLEPFSPLPKEVNQIDYTVVDKTLLEIREGSLFYIDEVLKYTEVKKRNIVRK